MNAHTAQMIADLKALDTYVQRAEELTASARKPKNYLTTKPLAESLAERIQAIELKTIQQATLRILWDWKDLVADAEGLEQWEGVMAVALFHEAPKDWMEAIREQGIPAEGFFRDMVRHALAVWPGVSETYGAAPYAPSILKALGA